MSAIENSRDSLAGLTLDAVLGVEKRVPRARNSAHMNRTLLDIIRDEEPHGSLFGHRDKKSWKAFRDRLRLKRAGAAWTSSVHIPASDIPIHNNNNSNNNNNNGFSNGYNNNNHNTRFLMSRRNSVRFTTLSSINPHPAESTHDDDDSSVSSSRPLMTRRSSTRFGSMVPIQPESEDSSADIQAVGEGPPSRSFRPQMSRHNSTRFPAPNSEGEDDEERPAREGTRRLGAALAEERALSAREAVAAQEAAEAEAAALAAAEAQEAEEEEEVDSPESEEGVGETQPVRMSLMDLLEETDRQMGLVGSRYTMGDEDEDYGHEEEEEEEYYEEDDRVGSGMEHTCCVCMVRHKGAAFIPCGHTFCRLCSRELWVQRGNCPLCNGFILEILDIF